LPGFVFLPLLAGMCWSASVELTWDRHPDLDVTGYIAYWGQSEPLTDSIDVGKIERAHLDGLADNKTYLFSVRAYDRSRNLGPASPPISFKATPVEIKGVNKNPLEISGQGQIQILPNPFYESLLIEFGMKGSTVSNLRVAFFSLNGRLVKTGPFKKAGEGLFHFFWNGRDQNGHNLQSGVYFIRVQSGKKTIQTKKVYLIK